MNPSKIAEYTETTADGVLLYMVEHFLTNILKAAHFAHSSWFVLLPPQFTLYVLIVAVTTDSD